MFINLSENIKLSAISIPCACETLMFMAISSTQNKKNILSSALSRRESAASSYAVQLHYIIKMHRSSQP